MTTVSALLRDIRHCRLCAEKLPFEPRPVVQFHPSARILIAAQAPGRKVHETGIPFNDASGDRLRAWLGLSREVFYDDRRIAILPMGFCYPGTGKSGDLPPRPECAPAWRETLLSQFEDLQLTLVIGQYAQAYHFPYSKKTLTENVLDWRETWPDRVPLPHPSPRNNRWLKNNPWFAECLLPDLRRRVAEVLSDSEE
ncbi:MULTISPECIES: uracil-DNA glycosylase family protein [unclassified Methylophaga]|uniref:uracil-DNA glycosylase family protein n=2 Tax=Methylophaga TaxID=40222 RepID=UPI000C89538A|nr:MULTISPECIES: uracil-DNA glycosylase family protein [unclassified Methylophaga]MAK66777.1 IclR family transcriptional regulator [Methylophaga sp.]MAY17655.1 IclR family transcriptional regulator [Methylophaga sp.]HAO23857.1 IclR family transcriptional regulator [Methylophaga sp.]HCD04391.1 IclR family transcriptional regulator [Methylophaga sp.]